MNQPSNSSTVVISRAAEFIPRRPAVATAGLFISGILMHRVVPTWPIPGLVLIALLAACAFLLRRREISCSLLLSSAILIGGIVTAQIEAFYYPRWHISAFAGEQRRLANLEFKIIQPPRVLTHAFAMYRALPPKQVTTARVTRVRTWRGWEDACGEMLVQVSQPHARLALGQTVRALGMLERPGPAMNPGQFDWANYYREQRILTSMQIGEAENLQILTQDSIGPLQRLREQARRALARGFNSNRALDHALLRALTLGDPDPELRDVQEQFRRTGTSHHLAISGLHIAVLGGVIFGICRALRCPPRAACWTSLAFVVVYGIVALPSPPVVRSVLLCVSLAIGILWRRSVDLIQLLALSVLAMLIYHPLDLYNAGFQLSFGTVLGLMIFTRPILPLLGGRQIDQQVALALARPGGFSLFKMKLAQHARATLAASLVAWVVSTPLVAIHFEQLNPWAVLASILLAPIVFASLIGGFLKIIFTLLWPTGAGAFASAAALPVAGMRHMVDWLATFPGADVPLPSPPIWIILLFYALLILPMIPLPRPGLRWPARIASLSGCLLVGALPVRANLWRGVGGNPGTTITLLAVGAGQCAVIEPPRGDAILIDAGSISLSDLLRKCLGPFLRHQGRRNISSIFITHANYDHYGSVGEITAAYDVRQILTPTQFAAQSAGNPTAENLLRTLDVLDRTPRTLRAGDRVDLGSKLVAEVLWPADDSSLDPNNSSMVLSIGVGGRKILFTGDIQSPAMRQLLRFPERLRADVLIAPHHGSGEEATEAFVAAVDPLYIVSSNDRTLSMKQRDFERMTGGRKLYRTHRCGAITIGIDPDGKLSVQTFLPAPDH